MRGPDMFPEGIDQLVTNLEQQELEVSGITTTIERKYMI